MDNEEKLFALLKNESVDVDWAVLKRMIITEDEIRKEVDKSWENAKEYLCTVDSNYTQAGRYYPAKPYGKHWVIRLDTDEAIIPDWLFEKVFEIEIIEGASND